MKFVRLGPPGEEIPAVLDSQGAWDLRPVTPDIEGRFLEDAPVERTKAALDAGELVPVTDLGTLRVGAPIARPGAVVCVGMNYAAHAAESGSAPPALPVIFLKTPNTVVGPCDDVTIPRASTRTDWEVELGVVIGQRASYLAGPHEARRHIAGFVTVNDLSEREFQLELSGGQWSKGKSAPGFTPTGPWLVTPDDVDPGGLRLRSWVNGEPRQDSTTADMVFDVDYLIWHLSQFMTLDPGDLALTGTPAGVALSGAFPYLRGQDCVEIEVEGLGRQRQRMIPWVPR